MNELLPRAHEIAALLKQRGETVAVAESSAGGLISAALLAVPGASAYFIGGGVVYTRQSREGLLGVMASSLGDIKPSSEPYALLLAGAVRERCAATWGLAETGTAGPTGSRYGYAAGRACLAVAGPVQKAFTVETGISDRAANMRAFAAAALDLLKQALAATKPN
jgi:nicotinamide-nucleotide amidase